MKHNREKQADVLRRTQAKNRENKKEQALKAIQEIITHKSPLTFANIAKVAGCSISYLYKWDEITDYIHRLQQGKETRLHPSEEQGSNSHGLKALDKVAGCRIAKLEAEIKELKVQNEKLRGHVVEIHELRDECERLRKQRRELTNPSRSHNVAQIEAVAVESIELSNISSNISSENIKINLNPPLESEILELIQSIGIKLN